MARQVIAAPLIIDARIRSASRVKDAQATGLAPGRARFYVEADVLTLIRGKSAVPARISYLADVPLDSRGRVPKLKKQRVLLFARPISAAPDQVQLTGADGQRLWLAELDSQIRGITREVLATDAPAAISSVGNAFHVQGSLPGEGETQIFLLTSTGSQISLQILRRPGQRPSWSVSTGDFIDESAGAPPKNTLLWYRLACGLPAQLPASAIESEDPADARIAAEDYALVRRELGPCA
ncbi:hypothetical protein P1X14_10575 [Sphingomonas sp. AOB5]|uniref:hypothetical protein n=1 Tax=Sphingomonas sp. AOB5 TaxID=3034017 RepID=UPI0023F6DC30|nr:hypothetical protein [Sphingomonas sp. AOB5]MDF7775691.1 hypothetical protein [Sphingomonas sp. AOB5]